MEGLTYQEDCYIGARNTIERFLCRQGWQETQTIKLIFGGLVLLLVTIIVLFAWKKFRK